MLIDSSRCREGEIERLGGLSLANLKGREGTVKFGVLVGKQFHTEIPIVQANKGIRSTLMLIGFILIIVEIKFTAPRITVKRRFCYEISGI